MHEFSFAHHIFKTVEAAAIKENAKKVISVTIELGELTLITPELLKKSFEMASAGSIVEGAELLIIQILGEKGHIKEIRCF